MASCPVPCRPDASGRRSPDQATNMGIKSIEAIRSYQYPYTCRCRRSIEPIASAAGSVRRW
ncbi:hypothetical protein E2562_028000 [Oryza meyeriana var. granulata]|uniref:Uncharacterized protein n=1 Tax=Oryza meyeriana var. granulata TaxID=110450 RepID=A0A6G1CSH7_9ORYZ|nr:hypothetical protein E2562_028000 [Oryza meyeriana var. granulata]